MALRDTDVMMWGGENWFVVVSNFGFNIRSLASLVEAVYPLYSVGSTAKVLLRIAQPTLVWLLS
jgi:hypothetical protein